ncbi:MAG: mechanosensitive ion channel family protein [Acidobacteria bacterium]|nr:mechanosensitive ion channel family protein [Acidobacteriota bacterium]
MPINWPELTLAVALALAGAYLIADLAARFVQSTLRAVIADPAVEKAFVDRPRRIIRLTIFLVAAAALVFPAVRIAGYQTGLGGSPRAVGSWLLDVGLRIVVIAIAAYLVIRIASAAARRLEREMSQGTGLDVLERTKRAQTLGRLLQKTLAIVVAGMAGLMILRQLDIDITPVLTGAGIAGLAIGFGAQTLVRDVLSGFFLILEDQVRVGDVAVVNGQGGLVEQVNLRTIVLRDEAGAVHVFPNGEVKTLANMSKDFSYAVLTLGVGYDADVDRAIEGMREAAASLMDDPDFRPHILEPLDVYGIDAFEPARLVIKARIKTVPLKQWLVGRELRKRIARRFAERGIEMGVPQMAFRMDREERPGGTPRAG